MAPKEGICTSPALMGKTRITTELEDPLEEGCVCRDLFGEIFHRIAPTFAVVDALKSLQPPPGDVG